ncbi:glucose-1-phosphate thymidylyltransferase [Ilyomonas limi]|uniref:Glucose-1-phosphate thymidylyltransferase n=1 Tax=Ilyomonas limi TaxID=2575867 RepID=A0A4U3L0R3_9BACT|nr:putative sugar nucleotidyl transferase [Ilyomonas limi]TKK68555.1 glucose-1-phosphate thymidylyltransferase [Ilyomonas limi]
MAIVLFDTERRSGLYPLTYTRAVADMRTGICTIQDRWRYLLNEEVYVETALYLQALYTKVPAGIHTFIDAQVMPSDDLINSIKNLQQGEVLEDEAGVVACKAAGESLRQAMDNGAMIFTAVDKVQRLQYAHQMIQWNKHFIEYDFKLLTQNKTSQSLSSTNHIIHPENVFAEEGANVEYAIINAKDGPVYIGKNAVIMEGCMIRGALALCEKAILKMGTKIYGATTIGTHCVAGGEIKNSIVQSFSNKGHDGYLGDSVVGQWCNLGAGSSNSNVKNTAGDILLWNDYAQTYVNAGNKCGVIMGDYSRVAINTAINTGSVYGVCCNVLGEGLLPKTLSNFSWGTTGGKYDLQKAYTHINQWKKMKGQIATDVEKAVLQHIFEAF